MKPSHREVETKYDVEDTTPLPELAQLPGVSRAQGPVTHHLEAAYFDTADLALGRSGITLRRRTGGEDEGWHLKIPFDGVRQEIHAPLGRSTAPPIALRRIIRGVVRDRPIGVVATLVTSRSVVSLLDGDGSLLAEVCDDRVAATRPRPDGDDEHSWREWEVEQHGAGPRLVKAADRLLQRAGARPSDHRSKLARAVGLGPRSAPVAPTADKHTTERELLGRQLTDLTADLHRLDPQARADLPDSVHQLRTACRRLRAVLATFEKCFEQDATAPVREDLGWIRDLLGRPRDLEVLRARLTGLVAAEDPELVRDRPGPWIDSQLRAAHRTAHREALEAMASERYFDMIDVLDSWSDAPPWADRRDRPARQRLAKYLDRDWADLEGAVLQSRTGSSAERAALLHDVRKAAKRALFAAQVLEPVLGRETRGPARSAKEIQRILGEHHDVVVARHQVLKLAATARAAGRDTFTYGVLSTRLVDMATELDRTFESTWRKAEKRRRRT